MSGEAFSTYLIIHVNTMKTVLIFGGSGFVANHIIRQLAKNGYKIVVLYQQPTNEAKLKFLGSLIPDLK